MNFVTQRGYGTNADEIILSAFIPYPRFHYLTHRVRCHFEWVDEPTLLNGMRFSNQLGCSIDEIPGVGHRFVHASLARQRDLSGFGNLTGLFGRIRDHGQIPARNLTLVDEREISH